jgi:hypothetical protein
MSAFTSVKPSPGPGPGPIKIEHKIDQLLVLVSLNIEGQSELELTSDLFSQEAPPGFKTEKYPFVSGNSKIDESTLSSKLYPEILKTFFVRDTFRTFIKEHGETPTGIEMDPGILEHNIMLMFRYLFDTYPTVNNVTDSLTQKLPITLIEKTHQYTYLNIGSKVYTVARVVLINDIYNHELYIKFANDFSAFESWKTSEIQTITRDYNKQKRLTFDIITKFKSGADEQKELTADIAKIKTYLSNKTNWTGLGNNATVRNALTVLKLHLERIQASVTPKEPDIIYGGTGEKPTKLRLSNINKNINKLIKSIDQTHKFINDVLSATTERIRDGAFGKLNATLKEVIDMSELKYNLDAGIVSKSNILPPAPPSKKRHLGEFNGGAGNTVKAVLDDVFELIGDIDDYIPNDTKSPIVTLFKTTQDEIENLRVQIESETELFVENLNKLFANNEIDADSTSKDNVVKALDALNTTLQSLSTELKNRDRLDKVIGDLKNLTRPMEQQDDDKAVEKTEQDMQDKLKDINILTPDFLSELNRTYKIINDNNTLALSVSVRTFIKDITEKNDITVKRLELLKYFRDTDMFKDYKKIDYDNADYKSLIDTVFAGKKVISKMINHNINNMNPELAESDLNTLVAKINGRKKGDEFDGKEDRTGISYDSTIVGKPRIGIRAYIDCTEGKVDDTNKHLIDMCSFRDQLLLDELEQLMAEKAEMLLHDPLMQLSKPKAIKTDGGAHTTCKRRGRRNRTRKKKRA